MPIVYRGWILRYAPKPGPASALDWEAHHPSWGEDPDAPHTRRAFTAASREECEREIDALEAEHVPCMACGAPAIKGQLCEECYRQGRTCGLRGELDAE